ncbi:paired amphipathic helix protein Sin3-like 3 [Cryptomeria japonica]|uniref:paired amphipathic helix protein Sin3-like 3 n=1 Tax=Cryptomeria japonica TaxID=3369 RepID=UPI0027DA67C2|nr:paired amphipathic helix protein Sin3-like 3 [Cryptomeria japonica]
MKRAAEKERSEIRGSKRCRFAEGYEEMPLPTEIDAQSYLISVKEHFKDDMGKFAEFIQILDDFRSKTCDAIKVIARLKQLVKSHELLLGFNKFLPKGFEILLPSEYFLRNEQQVQLKEALGYIWKIKTRFQNEEYIRKGFFGIFNAYMKGNKRGNDMHAEVKLLFCDHQDLVDEFAYFLPALTGSALVHHHQDSAMHVFEPAGILTSVKDLQKEGMGKQPQKYFTSNNN